MQEMFTMGQQDAINIINLGEHAILPSIQKAYKKDLM